MPPAGKAATRHAPTLAGLREVAQGSRADLWTTGPPVDGRLAASIPPAVHCWCVPLSRVDFACPPPTTWDVATLLGPTGEPGGHGSGRDTGHQGGGHSAVA